MWSHYTKCVTPTGESHPTHEDSLFFPYKPYEVSISLHKCLGPSY